MAWGRCLASLPCLQLPETVSGHRFDRIVQACPNAGAAQLIPAPTRT
jgi:hypothetical protein